MNDPLEGLGPLPESRAVFGDVAARLDECEPWDSQISLAALGDAPLPDHLSACASCREIYEGRRRAVEWLDILPTCRARAPIGTASWKRSVAAAAVLLVALAVYPVLPSKTRETSPPAALSVQLAEQLTDPDEDAIAQAARRITPGDLREIRALGAYLRAHAESDRRYMAIRLLVHVGGVAAEEELLRASADAAVAAGLGDLKSVRAVPGLISWLSRPELRSAAAAALGQIGDSRAIPALVREGGLHAGILKSFGDAVVRYTASHPDPALVALHDPSVHRALLDHAARVPAFQASLLDAADEDLLVQALLRPELREAALTRPVEALVPRLAARLPRPEAVWVLARIGSEQAWSAILSAGSFNSALPQADPARLARVALHWAADRERGPLLARLLPARPEYADFFRAALAVPEARAAACAAIRQLKDREAVPKLIPLLREDREVTYTLHSVTGEQFGLDRQAWWRWWHEATRKL